ncbi:hypothetical protein HOH87_02500 [bacterium]|jgi:hypothetical protein|nr:hypothetical protein [bacterium]
MSGGAFGPGGVSQPNAHNASVRAGAQRQAQSSTEDFAKEFDEILRQSAHASKVNPNESTHKQQLDEKKKKHQIGNVTEVNDIDGESIHKTISDMEAHLEKIDDHNPDLAQDLAQRAQLKIDSLKEQGYHLRDINSPPKKT